MKKINVLDLTKKRLTKKTLQAIKTRELNIPAFIGAGDDPQVMIQVPKTTPFWQTYCPVLPGDLERVLLWAYVHGVQMVAIDDDEQEPSNAIDLPAYEPDDEPPERVDIDVIAERIVCAPVVDLERFLGFSISGEILDRLDVVVGKALVGLNQADMEFTRRKFCRSFREDSTVIAVDFDGTLTHSDKWPDIGEPNWPVINEAIKRQREGACIVLWTCRTNKELDAAVNAARSWGLHFDAINETPEFRTRKYGSDVVPRKLSADEYWDDKAIHPSEMVAKKEGPLEIKVLIDEGGIFQGIYASPEISNGRDIDLELIDFVTDDEEELNATEKTYQSAKERAAKGELKVIWH